MPIFWTGLMALSIFSYKLGINRTTVGSQALPSGMRIWTVSTSGRGTPMSRTAPTRMPGTPSSSASVDRAADFSIW